jgi:hypothetical protein
MMPGVPVSRDPSIPWSENGLVIRKDAPDRRQP